MKSRETDSRGESTPTSPRNLPACDLVSSVADRIEEARKALACLAAEKDPTNRDKERSLREELHRLYSDRHMLKQLGDHPVQVLETEGREQILDKHRLFAQARELEMQRNQSRERRHAR